MHIAYRANNKWLLATPHGVAVLPGQYLLLRGLAALVCLVWGKAEPATRLSRTILHGALNGQTVTRNPNSRQLHLTHVLYMDIVGHSWLAGGLGHETICMHTIYN